MSESLGGITFHLPNGRNAILTTEGISPYQLRAAAGGTWDIQDSSPVSGGEYDLPTGSYESLVHVFGGNVILQNMPDNLDGQF